MMEAPADWMSGEGPLPGSETDVFLLCPHVVLFAPAELFLPVVYEGPDPIMGAHPPDLI